MLNELTLSPKTRTFLIYFLSLFFVFLVFPTDFYTLPYAGVDGSWQIGIHLAIKYHLLFGKEFVYTYGPLAALRLRFPIVLSKWAYIVSDCYYAYILFVGFSSFIRNYFRPGPLFFLICVVVIGLDWEMDKWYQFLLLLFLMSFLFQPEKKAYLLHAAVLALITFYVKVNSGLINIGFFLLVVTYALAVKKLDRRTYIFLLLSFLAALLLSARLFGVSLGSYILCTLFILKDYEDIMYLPLGGRLGEVAPWFAGIFLLVMFACYVFVLLKMIKGRRLPAQLDAVVTYLLVAAAIFIWYKNAFVRADGHVFQFFVMAGPLAFFLYIFTPPELGKRTVAVFCWALLGIDFCSLLFLPDSGFPGKMGQLFNFSLITAKVRSVGHYAEGIRGYDRARAVTDSTTSVPSPYRQAVGDHSADIIPTEISLLYTNGLRYAPRPTAQSYAAYDGYLDRLNYDSYLSPRAPDYVFFTLDGTEDRSAWMDEGRIKLALLARYRPERMIADQLLLKKEEQPRDMIKIKEDTLRTEMGKEIPVEKGPGILFTRFLVERNWAGKFRSFVYQPPDLVMEYKMQDGEVRYFKVLKPLLEDGMVLNKFVNSTPEFRLFLLSDGQLNENVHSVRLQPTKQGGYQPKITVINTWYAFAPRSASRLQQDSLELLRLTHNHAFLASMAHPPSGNDNDSIRYGLEYIRNHAGLIRIAGWAIHPRRDNRNYIVKVLARSADSVYELPSDKYSIPAYPYELWNRVDLDSSGFLSVFAKDQLPKGNYQLGIAIYHQDNSDSNSVQYFDRYFDVEPPYRMQAIARVDAAGEKPENIKYGIDFVGSEDDQLVVRGWAVLPANPHRSPTNLILQNDTATYIINANLQRRADIEGSFKDTGFLFSGFTAFLPRTSGPRGVFYLGIEKISPDGRTRSRVLTASKLRLGLPESFTPVRTDSLPSAGKPYGNFDTIDEEDDFVTVGGWALLDTLHAPDRIQIVFRNGRNNFVTPAVDQASRVDIAGKYRNNDLMDAGFSARIEKTTLPKGKYQLGLYVHSRSNAAPGLLLLNRFIEKK